jgi:hypothetical protein
MNRVLCVMIIFLLTLACQKGSGNNIPGAYSIQPDTLTPFNPIHSCADGIAGIVDGVHKLCDENFSLSFKSATIPGNYAVLYQATIDGVQKVGIAVSDNPNSEAFNLKIYFDASDIPTNPKNIDDPDLVIKVRDSSGNYVKQTSSGVTISFSKIDKDCTKGCIYQITSSGVIKTSGGDLDISGSYAINALDVRL